MKNGVFPLISPLFSRERLRKFAAAKTCTPNLAIAALIKDFAASLSTTLRLGTASNYRYHCDWRDSNRHAHRLTSPKIGVVFGTGKTTHKYRLGFSNTCRADHRCRQAIWGDYMAVQCGNACPASCPARIDMTSSIGRRCRSKFAMIRICGRM